MPMIRNRSTLKRDYTILANKMLRDKDLSLQAVGLIAYLSTFSQKQIPDDITIKEHFNLSHEEYFMLSNELHRSGYLDMEVHS